MNHVNTHNFMVFGCCQAWRSQTSKQYQQCCQSPEPYYLTVTCNLHGDLEEPIISYKKQFYLFLLSFWICTNFLEQNSTIMKTFFFELAGLTQLVPLQAPERRARNSKPARLPSQFSQDFRSRARVIVFQMFTLLSGQFLQKQHCNPVQGKYRASTGFSLCTFSTQGKTCFHYRVPR